jgi:hypothetical protein
MSLIINPGTGPVDGATEAQATANMTAFVEDLGLNVEAVERTPAQDYGEGRYAFTVRMEGRSCEVQMPGIPLARVRYMRHAGQQIGNYPRLYVDGSSWVWFYALGMAKDALTGEEGSEE